MRQPEKEYAEALFLLSTEKGCTDAVQQALHTVREAVQTSPEYVEFLSTPAIPLTERLAAIDEAFGTLPEYVVSFLKLMCENGHIRTLVEGITEFDTLVRTCANRTVAQVTSATPLDDAQKAALCAKLQTLLGKSVDAVYTVDASLIGGVIIEAEGKTYDGSIRHRLHDVKDVMIR